jgi:tRNA A-37 threonylcarbamoyl transferase component Bud32
VSLIENNGEHFVVKRYNIKGFWHGLKRAIRPSRAWVSWQNAHRLFFILGISTPLPILLMEKRWGPFRSKAYFVSEYIEGVDIRELLHSAASKDLNAEVVKQVSDLIQSLADASISHGDFKATNFIYSKGKVFLVDLDAMREHWFRWRFRRAFKRDLQRFMQNWKDLPHVAESFQNQISSLKI